jgi:sugar phosphate permease
VHISQNIHLINLLLIPHINLIVLSRENICPNMLFIKKILRNKIIRYAYIGWFVISLFYLYQYILRVSPGVMYEEIRQTFRINAEQFATLGALYLLSYSLLQVPLGITVDRIGVKKMCLYSIATLSFGAFIMAVTEAFWIAQLSRFIIGAGSASAFMCALKFIADHIPPGNRGFLMGVTLAFGTCGALFSGSIVRHLDAVLSWRSATFITGCIGLVIFLLIAFVVRGHDKDKNIALNEKSLKENLQDVLRIFCTSKILIYAILAIGLYAPLSALADLWGAAFLRQKYGLSKADSAQLIMVLYIGLTLGSLILPWFCEKYRILNIAIIVCGCCLLIMFSMVIYMPAFNTPVLVLILFLIGFFCGSEMMCFTGALEQSNKYDSGQIVGVVNTLNMLGGAIIQQLIGYFLDKNWDGTFDDLGMRHYSTLQFQQALSVLTVLVIICCACSAMLLARRFNNLRHQK